MKGRTIPTGVTPGQIIVDGNQMGAQAGQGVEIQSGNGGKSFTLAGFLLSDFAFMKSDPGHQLDVVGTKTNRPVGSFADDGKSFRKKIVQGGAFRQAMLEIGRGGGKVL